MRELGTYIAENLRLSVAAWGEAHRVGSLTAAIVSLIVALLVLTGTNAKIQPDTFQGIAILAAGAWFITLLVIVTPYRMWLAQRRQIGELTERIRTAIMIPGQQALLEQKRRQEKADGYRRLREQAIALRGRLITSAEGLAQLEGDIDRWRDEATDFIRAQDGHTSARHFRESFYLVNSALRPYPKGFNSNHSSRLAVLGEYQDRLQRLYDDARDRLL